MFFKRKPTCQFCGRSPDQPGYIIESGNGAICGSCVLWCVYVTLSGTQDTEGFVALINRAKSESTGAGIYIRFLELLTEAAREAGKPPSE